jgi:aryl-alcohol dehydrogenase-like predicted oxidoreductase
MHHKTSTYLRLLSAQAAGPIPRRPLGRTGLEVTILGMGGESALKQPNGEDEAIEILQAAYKLGINYFDTASSYEHSEERIGKALSGVRKDIILASKTHERTRDGAWRELEASLRHLKTDHLDIWQIHHIDDMEEVKVAMGPDGSLTALIEAREQGIVRFLGITGHYDPSPLLEAIQHFEFDMTLLSLNAADVHHRSFIKKLLPEAIDQNLGIVGMKVCCRGRLFDPNPGHLNNMKDAMSYVLTLPVSCVIIGHGNLNQLLENIQFAQEFQPLNRNQLDDIENSTKEYADIALFFRKDNEEHNPFWKSYPQKLKEIKKKQRGKIEENKEKQRKTKKNKGVIIC